MNRPRLTLCKPETRELKPAATGVTRTFRHGNVSLSFVAAGFSPRVSGLQSVGGGDSFTRSARRGASLARCLALRLHRQDALRPRMLNSHLMRVVTSLAEAG